MTDGSSTRRPLPTGTVTFLRYGVRPPMGLEQLIRRTDPGVRLQGIMAPATLEAALDRGRRMTIDEAMDVVVRIADAVPPDDGMT
jgi:hypothetical protein